MARHAVRHYKGRQRRGNILHDLDDPTANSPYGGGLIIVLPLPSVRPFGLAHLCNLVLQEERGHACFGRKLWDI